MRIIRSPKIMSEALRRLRSKGKTIGFVPTMGALHEGHLSLIRRARKDTDIVVVSIFVNPRQFGPKEDFRHYPRPMRKDILLCRKERVDFIFHPSGTDIYPAGYRTFITVEGLDKVLCGKSRPGHFRGVATVVAKLFNIVAADIAYFGQKDAQQVIIIQRMVKDLNIPVKIKVMPIVRDKDGLALSSRNTYLSRQERQDALVIPKSLDLARAMIESGIKQADRVASLMRYQIKKNKTAKPDYIAIVDQKDLRPLDGSRIKKGALIALAIRIGNTRLIDNYIVR
ncbi:MAG: pantoate--beta-alanine ligase [Candidatus Omnitrophica bacterium]|nr:pantoate--beta-alanine ligase [Candidatus Omnitrophota bacterium]